MLSRFTLRPTRSLAGFSILLLFLGSCAFVIWYGMNSDQDNIPPLLTQLIPAGHCMCQTSTNFVCGACLDFNHSTTYLDFSPAWEFQYARDGHNLGLDEAQCQASFPGLFEDISRATNYWQEHGNISSCTLDGIRLQYGLARVAIVKGELYVVAVNSKGEDHRRKVLAVLNSIYRALSSDKNRFHRPDIEFVLSVEDKLSDIAENTVPVWVLARKVSEEAAWLMPDFGLWAWENVQNGVGPFTEVIDTIVDRERDESAWPLKKQRLVWRGKLSFAPKLRRALMEVTRDRDWADVKPLDWTRKDNFLSMVDHCRYMFIAHAEGRSYSASLKYRQACRSVIVVHKLQYIQHHHYLMVSSGPKQNFVEVERDFSDLSEKVEALLADPAAAKRIADNNIETFRERYLTPAASVCYWRALFKSYACLSR